MFSFWARLLLVLLCVLPRLHAHLSGTRNPNVCANIRKSTERMFKEWDNEEVLTFSKVSPIKTPVLKAFAGEKRTLRCLQSKQQENIGWFLSETSPFSKSTMTHGLVQVPEESACYRIYQSSQNITVNILEVLVQKETIGFFTCAEEREINGNKRIWAALDVYLITMYEPATEVYDISVHSIARSCDKAEALLQPEQVISQVPYLELNHPLIDYSWGDTTCSERHDTDPCYKPTGRDGQTVPNDDTFWKRTKLAENVQLYKNKVHIIPLVITGEHMRIRLKGVQIYRTGHVWFDFYNHKTTITSVIRSLNDPYINMHNGYDTEDDSSMASVVLNEETVCSNVWDSTATSQHFEYIILEPMLSYMEFPGGIRVPFRKALNPVDFREIRILRIKTTYALLSSIFSKVYGQSIASIYFETPTRPEDLLERMIPRGPPPEPRVGRSKCGQNYALTRHMTSVCHNLPLSCFSSDTKEHNVKVLHDVSHLPISAEPVSSLITVDSLLRLSEVNGIYYELLFIVKEVNATKGNYIIVFRILWQGQRIRLIDIYKDPQSELDLPLPGPTERIQQARMDILFSQGMRKISVAFRLKNARRATDTTFITPPAKGSIELHYRDKVEGVEYCGVVYEGKKTSRRPAPRKPPPQEKPASVLPTDDQIRRSSVPTYGVIFWMFTCLMGLLTLVVYFFLEGVGFMLCNIARGKRRRRPPPRRTRGKQQYLTEMAVFRDIPIQTDESWICLHGAPSLLQDLVQLRDTGIQTGGGQERREEKKGVEDAHIEEAAGRSNKASGRAELVSRRSQT